MSITLIPISNLPHFRPGDDLAGAIVLALEGAGMALEDGDVLAVAQKIVSKVEGRFVNLADVAPGPRALELARETGKDARLVELILRESEEVSRAAPNLIIVRHRLGFTSANAGIDRSNVEQGTAEQAFVLLLPEDPDASAARLRRALQEALGVAVGVLIVDSHGRPFRLGTVGAAIGVAGLPALWNRRGERDLYGFRLQHTEVAIADEIAAAAGLLMGQAAEGLPAVIVRGLTLPPGAGTARDLVRPKDKDLYR
jgi:coenzyme F420-0:L-glutamate ligase / coenzyme F420-1:gamma-L-glutamate ligase